MRASRFAPLCALFVFAATIAVAVLTSRAEDWDRPLIIGLVAALALIADRYEVQTSAGTMVVATHPAFVLGMMFLAPAPLLLIGELVIFSNRAKTPGRLIGNAAIYGAFLTVGSLLGGVARDHLGVATS